MFLRQLSLLFPLPFDRVSPAPAKLICFASLFVLCLSFSLRAAGYFQDGPGAAGCDACWPGSFAAGPGSLSCATCAAGSFSPTDGASSCTVCLPGSFSAAGSSGCTQCPAGSFAGGAGTAGACTPASPGYYTPGVGATTQSACPAGTFSASSGQGGCTVRCSFYTSPQFLVAVSAPSLTQASRFLFL